MKTKDNTNATRSQKTITIAPPQHRLLKFTIVGVAPYLCHAWSEKAKEMLRMTAAERKKRPKVARNPVEEAELGTYRVKGGPSDGDYGVPAMAIKTAMIDSAHKDRGLAKTDVKKALRFKHGGIIPLRCSKPEIREDIVRVGMNQTDIRYRNEFAEWSVEVELVFDAEILTAQDIINLANRAGFATGIGEWRPQNGGEHGRFEVDSTQPITEEDC